MRMGKGFLVISILVFSFLGCKNLKNGEKSKDFNKEFNEMVDDYVDNNPIHLPLKKTLGEDNFSHPLYQLYFDIKDNDTIVSIVQTPFFNDLKLEGSQANDDPNTINFDALSPKGFMLYGERAPLVIFDEHEIGEKFYANKKLTKVPDSLKSNGENYHIKFVKWDYKLNDGKTFIRIQK